MLEYSDVCCVCVCVCDIAPSHEFFLAPKLNLSKNNDQFDAVINNEF